MVLLSQNISFFEVFPRVYFWQLYFAKLPSAFDSLSTSRPYVFNKISKWDLRVSKRCSNKKSLIYNNDFFHIKDLNDIVCLFSDHHIILHAHTVFLKLVGLLLVCLLLKSKMYQIQQNCINLLGGWVWPQIWPATPSITTRTYLNANLKIW